MEQVTTSQELFETRPGTPEFDAWFGDSVVVDADGKPMVVYHGTNVADMGQMSLTRSLRLISNTLTSHQTLRNAQR
jgi:hypothetical protein